VHPDGQSNPGGAVGAGGDPLVDPVGQRCDPLRIDAARQRGVGAAERLNPGVRHGASSGPRGHQRMPAGREPASNLQVGGPGQRRSRRSVTLHRILKHQCCDHVPVTDARKGPPSRQAAPVGAGFQRGHEAAGVGPATALLDRFNINTLDGFDVRGQVLAITAEHLRPSAFHKARDTVRDGAFRRLAARVDLELLVRFGRADCHGRTGTFDCSAMDWFLERARALGVEHAAPAPILLGRHLIALGVTPGPRMGEILRAIYERQLDGVVTTLEEAIAASRAEL